MININFKIFNIQLMIIIRVCSLYELKIKAKKLENYIPSREAFINTVTIA